MKPDPSTRFWRIFGIPIVIAVVLGCFCLSIVINSVAWVGGLFSAPFRWLQGLGAEPGDLVYMLRSGDEAAFQLSPGCQFSQAAGTRLRSNYGPGENPAQDLPRQEVIAQATADLQSLTFQIEDGEIHLPPNTPVYTEIQPEESVILRTEYPAPDGTSLSLNGVIVDGRFTGQYYRTSQNSPVPGGQGASASETLQASLSCPLAWLPAE